MRYRLIFRQMPLLLVSHMLIMLNTWHGISLQQCWHYSHQSATLSHQTVAEQYGWKQRECKVSELTRWAELLANTYRWSLVLGFQSGAVHRKNCKFQYGLVGLGVAYALQENTEWRHTGLHSWGKGYTLQCVWERDEQKEQALSGNDN